MRRPLLILAVAGAASMAFGPAASSADKPTARASATVTACAGKGGALRVATRCRRGERRFRLVADPAPQGPKGDAGRKGDAGAKGDAGSQGIQGLQGPAGADGASAYNAEAGLDLAGTVFSVEMPFFFVRDSSPSPSLIDVTHTRHESAFGPVRPAAIEGTATSTADGNTAAGAVTGVLGTIEQTAPGGFSAGVRGVNNGIGVAGLHMQSGWGVYGRRRPATAWSPRSPTAGEAGPRYGRPTQGATSVPPSSSVTAGSR